MVIPQSHFAFMETNFIAIKRKNVNTVGSVKGINFSYPLQNCTPAL